MPAHSDAANIRERQRASIAWRFIAWRLHSPAAFRPCWLWGRMIGIGKGVEERERPSFDRPWQRRAPSIWLRGSFEMTARLDADELTHALDRDPELANAQARASERGRCPGLVECRISAPNAVLPLAFTQHAVRAFDAGAKKLVIDIDVCLLANGRTSPSSTPYKWLIVSWVNGQAFRLTAGRPMMLSPREVSRPSEGR